METKNWYTERWPPLAWLETVVKLAGMAYGFSALPAAFNGGPFSLPQGAVLVQWLVLTVLSVGLVAAIRQRLQMREVVSMAFVILNNIAHWGLVVGILAGERGQVMPFAALFLAGDLIKIGFIRLNRFRVEGYGAAVLYGLTMFYAAGYLVVLLAGWLMP